MKRILFSLLILMAASVWAQPVMNGIEISVTEKYTAQVAEGIKITGQPNVMDTTVEKLPVKISVRNRTWVPEPRLEEIPALKISRTRLERLPANTVHMALGNYASANVSFALGNARSDLNRWGISGEHFSTQGGFRANDANDMALSVFNRSTWLENNISGHYARIIGRGRISAKGQADWNRYTFYGQPYVAGSNDADTAMASPGRWVQNYQVALGYEQSRIRRKQVFHGADLIGHHWIDQGGRQTESGLAGGIDWKLPVQDVVLELPIKGSWNHLMQASNMDSTGLPFGPIDYWAAQFSPAVSDSVGSIYFRVGLNAIFTGKGGQLDKPYLPPVVHLELPLVREVLNVYVGLEGSADNGGMRSRVQDMPFLSETAEYQAVRQANLYAGASGRLTSSIGYRFGVRQRSYANYAMYIRDYSAYAGARDSGRFQVQYTGVTMLEPSGELSFQNGLGWELRAFALLRRATRTSGGSLYHVPSSEIGAQAFFNLQDKIRFESTVIYRGSRLASGEGGVDQNLPGYLDGRLSAVYTYNKQLNATFKVDNLFHSRATWWLGYPVQGIRANLGLVYKF
ncbi:MAG: hypothetical protein P8N56_07385 [Schleiferiaceae bacterium]|nr:hypothetical protein [Schleiferiaceae bacterium]